MVVQKYQISAFISPKKSLVESIFRHVLEKFRTIEPIEIYMQRSKMVKTGQKAL